MGELLYRYCRLCWNSKNWVEPTGEAADIESGSFVSDHGFGHEEWTFNFNWVLPEIDDGSETYVKYAFFEPIRRYYEIYKGQEFQILLYTKRSSKITYWVGVINRLKIIEEDEARRVLGIYTKNGWLREMGRQIRALGYRSEQLDKSAPTEIFNVKFKLDDVYIFDPKPLANKNHEKIGNHRYQLMIWDKKLPKEVLESYQQPGESQEDADSYPRRSEHKRKRSGGKEALYDPLHVKIQNAFYDWLVDKYGKKNILYEKNYVDLTLNNNGIVTFYEIKTNQTVKGCIREGIGQLLEYSHFPNAKRANSLVVVGIWEPKESDKEYMEMLRVKYGLPIHYAQWSIRQNRLMTPV